VGCRELGFYPASAVLPTSPFGRILTGDEAYKERTHAGFPWPPEARIQPGEPIRRSPISAVWRSLVEAGDHMVRWDAGRGLSFSLARILASHVKGLMAGVFAEEDRLKTGSGGTRSSMPVVAIPDHLDEFGQELLLRELAALGCPEAMLVWRPVAAALTWLNKVEGDFPTRMGQDDHMHVIYLGPDALEFTTFRLRVKEHNNQYYVLPLRDRPKGLLPLTGVDWAARLIEECFPGIDEGAFWQAFIQFPEIWQALAGQSWNQDDLPRPWSRSREWTLWEPPSDIHRRIYDTSAASCVPLRLILNKSCKLGCNEDEQSSSVGEAFRREVERMAGLFPAGRLRGMIVCGSLAPRTLPPWLSSQLNLLSSRGLSVEGNLSEPEAGRLWLSADRDDPVSEGAAIYGRRILDKIPSYLDTIPQISILAQEGGRFVWVPLLKAQEVPGGQEHKEPKIMRQFQLGAGKRNLHVYLYKGSVEDAPKDHNDPFDIQVLPEEGITPCWARLVREMVRTLGSLENVQSHPFFRTATRKAQYGRVFAEALFTTKSNKDAKTLEPSASEGARPPLRRAMFEFPSAPDCDTVLDIEVRIRPASGLAMIEILPEDASFLQGDKVLLNYSTMRAVSKLPRRMRGWPRIEELVVDPEDDVLLSKELWINSFENTLPTARDYIRVLDGLRNNVIKGTTRKLVDGLYLYVGAIDQNGRACTNAGNETILRIAEKLEGDFHKLQALRQTPTVTKLLHQVCSRAAWLYGATPPNITAYLRSILRAGYTTGGWNTAVEAASRAFDDVKDFQLLFLSIAHLAQSDPSDHKTFPIHAARSICRILMLRRDGERGLDRNMAQLFAHRALQRLLKEQEEKKFKMLYFQMVRLLFYLLRYRKIEPLTFDSNLPQTVVAFEEAKKSMITAKESFPKGGKKAGQIQKLIEGFDRYLRYEGTEDIISVLNELAEDTIMMQKLVKNAQRMP
jgi:hypothetical protein